MPPTEVRERIDENCRKIGYDRGVVISMSVFESKVVADFDCRGGRRHLSNIRRDWV
jgi:hypothetical protein